MSHFNKENWLKDRLQESDECTVFLHFTAAWSGSSFMLGALIDQITKKNDSLRCYQVDIEEMPEIAAHFRVTTVPTVLILRKHELIDYIKGMVNKSRLTRNL